MPRYDASQDADLRKAVQHAREKQFFLGQYRKRKFISDKSALFDETVSNKEKRRCGLMDNTPLEIKSMYKDLICKVSESLFFRYCVTLVDTANLESLLIGINEVVQTINGLQWHLAVYENRLAQRGISPAYLYNREYCQFLLKDKEIYDIVEKLTCTSLRYGLLITDLCSDFCLIDIKKDVDVDDPSLFPLFFYYLDFDQVRNPHILQENGSLQRSRLLKYYNNKISGKVIDRLGAAAAKKALANLIPGSFHSRSILSRRAGLWLWDNCENPANQQKMTKSEAIQTLLSATSHFKDLDESSLIREFNRVYDITKKSIKAGEILPIEDGKQKNIIVCS